MRLNQVTVGALDLASSIAFYEMLGLVLIVRADHYARFELPEGDSTFSLHQASEAPGPSAPAVYFECDDLDDQAQRLAGLGVAFDLPPTDQSWLWREAHLRDPAGNRIILYRAGENRKHPPWRLG
ncbi:MAG: VOC family protein [Hyphomonadaceae bacterium]|nr:VOC family protein [Hyphomonadaceae bacterium]